MNDAVDYSDYEGLVPDETDNGTVNFNDYDSLNSADPLDIFDIKYDEPPFDYVAITDAISKVTPINNSSIEWLKNNSAKDIIDSSVTRKKNDTAKELGIPEESIPLADMCGILMAGDLDPVVSIPETIKNSKIGTYAMQVAESVRFPEGSTVLTALACFSAASSLCYSVEYLDGTPLPVGLYMCVSQPPGTGKSRVMNLFTAELNKRIGMLTRNVMQENEKQGKNGEHHFLPSPIMSNATPEAVEASMVKAGSGRYVILSSEQGAIDRILNIGVNDRATDNDIVLKGFVGEYHSSARVNRTGFIGEVFGTIAMISQPGTAAKVIGSSNGMGIAERFMFAQEPSILGHRVKSPPILKKESKQGYDRVINAIVDRYAAMDPKELNQLMGLRLCEKGYGFMEDLHDIREPKLKFYDESGSDMMTGALSKIDQQIMKIAANIHIYENMKKGGNIPSIIELKWVEQATYLAFEMLSKLETFLIGQGEMGEESKQDLILSRFDKVPKATVRSLCDNLKNNKKFKSRDDIKVTIDGMLKEKLLIMKEKTLMRVM